MKLNIDLGKYVITGSSHDLILSEKKLIQKGNNAGEEVLSRLGYFSKFEHLVKETCHKEILESDAQTLQELKAHIDNLSQSLSSALTSNIGK